MQLCTHARRIGAGNVDALVASVRFINQSGPSAVQYTQKVLTGLLMPVTSFVQGGALNRGLFFADPPPSLLGALSGKISEIR
jgi:hypothetical protein